ncbi:MAG: hypothetical protein OK454_08690, partial [Thaumarchaeota archaeon]|nr:hypothetical protein [Nitrososphaerota archaeon]
MEAGSTGSPVLEADTVGEVDIVTELAAPAEDDDAVMDEPTELVEFVAIVVEDVLAVDVLKMEVMEDDVDLEVVDDVVDEEDEDFVEEVEEVVEDDGDFE